MAQKETKTVDVSELENGPVEERECRDVVCCILFLANIVCMVYCSYYAYTLGNPSLIFRGTDVSNNICGTGAAADYKYLYFTNPVTLSLEPRVCVKECPKWENGAMVPAGALDCLTNTNVTSCTYTYTIGNDGVSTNSTSIANGDVVGYDSTAAIDRVCIPSTKVFDWFNGNSNNETTSTVANSVTGGYLSNLIEDIQHNWQLLLAGFGVAIIISFIIIFLMRCLAGCIVWLSIFGVIGFLIALGFILGYSGGLFGDQPVSYMGYTVPKITAQQEYLKYYAYGVWGFTGLMLIIILCMCGRIKLAVAVCKCAGKFILDVCSVMMVPVIMALVTVVLWTVCAVCMVYLVSGAKYIANGDVFTSIQRYDDPMLARFYYFVFGTLWSNALVQAMTTFVIASATCMWYYSQGSAGETLHLPVLRSYGRAFRYHFGSLAFGSFILAVVQFLQLMVEAFKKQAENTGADKNKAMEYLINCLRCCLACVERIVQFINKNAYIQIALSGKNFCMAAKDGFELVWANPLRYAVVSGIGGIIMFLGKVAIAAASTAAMYAYLTYGTHTVMGKLLFLLLVFIYSYAVAVVFMIVYGLAMDALLACFIVDETNDKNKGGKGNIRAPEELKDLMDNQ